MIKINGVSKHKDSTGKEFLGAEVELVLIEDKRRTEILKQGIKISKEFITSKGIAEYPILISKTEKITL